MNKKYFSHVIILIYFMIYFIFISSYYKKHYEVNQQFDQIKIYKSEIVKFVKIDMMTTNGDGLITVIDNKNNKKTINLIGYPNKLRRTMYGFIKAKYLQDLIGKDIEMIYEENFIDENKNIICIVLFEIEKF